MVKEKVGTLYLLCGFIGSGKTTYARYLAQTDSAFRFSIDEWMIHLYGEHMEREAFDRCRSRLQDLFKEAALQMLNLGMSVIFDYGFWKRAEREDYMNWASEHGVACEIHYVEASFDTCCERALARNKCLEHKSYEMTPEMLALFWSWFEPPHKETIKFVEPSLYSPITL